jgi:exportin-T
MTLLLSDIDGLTPTGNNGGFETLLDTMQRLAEDVSDPASQRASFVFLGRCVQAWGQLDTTTPTANQNGLGGTQETLPGFVQFMYQRLVPTAFRVPSLPTFNIKDGQMLSVRSYLRRVNSMRLNRVAYI